MEMKQDLLEQAKGLMALQENLLDKLEKKRSDQLAVSREAETIKDNLLRVNREKYQFYAMYPEAQEADPTTGKKNKDWSQMNIEALMSQDKEYVEALGAAYEVESRMAEINNAILDIGERLTVTKGQVRLVAAMLGVLSNE